MQDPIKAMYQSGRYEEPSYETPPREPSPVPLQEPPRIPIPVYHRALLPGEAIRRGDKVLAAGSEKWIKVEESLRGTLVSNGEAGNNGEAGPCYCRPVHPYSQTWYVDLRPGRRLIRQASERYSVSRFDHQQQQVPAGLHQSLKSGGVYAERLLVGWKGTPGGNAPSQERLDSRAGFLVVGERSFLSVNSQAGIEELDVGGTEGHGSSFLFIEGFGTVQKFS